MKFATVFVQVALVVVGILVYDNVRSEDGGADAPEPVVITRTVPLPEADVPPPPIVLEGNGVALVIERQASLERRLADMEKRLASRTTVVGDMSGYGPGGRASDDTADPGDVAALEGDEGPPRRFGEQEIAWFRDLKKQVDDIERHERYVEVYGRQLDRLEVSISPDQRTQIIDGMISYREKQRNVFKAAGEKNLSREDRQAALDELQQEYSETVYSLIPSSEAQKIVESMTRSRAFGTRGRPGAGGRMGPR